MLQISMHFGRKKKRNHKWGTFPVNHTAASHLWICWLTGSLCPIDQRVSPAWCSQWRWNRSCKDEQAKLHFQAWALTINRRKVWPLKVITHLLVPFLLLACLYRRTNLQFAATMLYLQLMRGRHCKDYWRASRGPVLCLPHIFCPCGILWCCHFIGSPRQENWESTEVLWHLCTVSGQDFNVVLTLFYRFCAIWGHPHVFLLPWATTLAGHWGCTDIG